MSPDELIPYSQVKKIYKRAENLYYENQYDERNLAHDMIETEKLKMEIRRLRKELTAYKQYALELDRKLQGL